MGQRFESFRACHLIIFVKSSAEKGKKLPHSQFILDQTGQVKNTWQLQLQESLTVVLDKTALPTRKNYLRNKLNK
ncbi:hypothetical protein HYE55_10530 [Aggregatibacter actinomycetemcomitans]|nr:hypothetical protein [Aggregatibacter actinomycetemcomitans]MBN6082466.1 hypothetical protein [Aggregatibacter actinomycetemcomitans]MBN6083419.1 hypothetical protein [Aggregatibacter actinomycetemcomitans]